MLRVFVVSFASFLSFASMCYATNHRVVGSWLVEIEKDPFSTKKKSIVANAGAGGVLAIRCFPDDGLTVLVLDPKASGDYEKEASINFKYRADEGAITDDKAVAFGPKAALLPNPRTVLQDARKASTLFLRIEVPDGTATDMSFKMKGSEKALASVIADCPEPPPEGK